MSFVRAKEIPPHSGNWYDYEVKTVSEDGKPRQKVIQYIGKSGTVSNPVLLGDRPGLSNTPANQGMLVSRIASILPGYTKHLTPPSYGAVHNDYWVRGKNDFVESQR